MINFKDGIKHYKDIEEEFFETDKEAGIARVKLKFEKPSDIFDLNYISKIPVLSDEFLDWIGSAFELIPSKYKIDLDVSFEDLEGWSEQALLENFEKNMMLEHKRVMTKQRKKNRVAFALIGVGVIMFIAMLLINNLWTTSSVLKDIFSYVSDIATTVTFWEAMVILVVERGESGLSRKSLVYRFASIKFHGQENGSDREGVTV